MIKIIIISCLFLCFLWSCTGDMEVLYPTELNFEWQLISKNNADQYVNEIVFVDSEKGWMIGNEGTILMTNNGGYSWQTQESYTTKKLRAISFINRDEGWITGLNNTLLYTSNGGKKWQQINIHNDTTKHNTDIYFIDEQKGWLLTNHGDVFKTNDGGNTWEKLFEFPNFGWSKIRFKDSSFGYAMQFYGNKLMTTEDGGISWKEYKLSIAGAKLGIMVRDIYFVDRFTGYYIYSWASGGIMEMATPVMKTEDGGYKWVFQDSVMNPYLRIIHFFDKENGLLAGSNCIYTTESSGLEWECIAKFNESDIITDIYFLDNEIGWGLASNGTIYRVSIKRS